MTGGFNYIATYDILYMLLTLIKRKADEMKKLAYTLAEALIAMAVIGIIAAITLPMINKFIPDGNKALYLKTYDSLVEITQALVANRSLYPITNEGDGTIYTNYPLYNTNFTAAVDGTNYGGNVAKYCQLLATSFGDVPTNCSSNTLPAEPSWTEANISFTAPNGVTFMVYTDAGLENGASGRLVRYRSDVYIDVDGIEKGNNCTFDAASCKQPDRFKFEVASDGKIIASDIKGQEYLATRMSLRLYKDEDLRTSLGLVAANLTGQDWKKPYEGEIEIELPDGESWADWCTASQLRNTYVNGIYCEIHNPDMPLGDYSNQRHVYWHKEAGRWVELNGVYKVDKGGEYDGYAAPYDGDDRGDILLDSYYGSEKKEDV